jgi:hypothetical protein
MPSAKPKRYHASIGKSVTLGGAERLAVFLHCKMTRCRTCATARPQLAKADTAFQDASVGQPTEVPRVWSSSRCVPIADVRAVDDAETVARLTDLAEECERKLGAMALCFGGEFSSSD